MIRLFRQICFYIFALSLCVLTGCDEQMMFDYLKSYGVQVNGKDVTIEDVRKFLVAYEQERKAVLTQQSTNFQNSLAIKENDTDCNELLITTPRGLSCLHCLQPEARTQANLIALLLKRSCLKNPAINYLVDGSFSFDAEVLYRHITLLTENGRQLFLYFYLTNGPSQRLWRETPIRALGTKMSPQEFRNHVKYDYQLQYQFQLIVRRLIPFIRYANSRGAIVSLLPALEDNLDNESFQILYKLALDALPHDLYIAFGRNACEGCFKGNEGYVPDDLFKEMHLAHPYFNLRDGVITNDGHEYQSLANSSHDGDLNLTDLEIVRDRAELLNDTFILWSARRQGISSDPTSMLKHPRERKYFLPNYKERLEIINFLRGEL